MSKVPTAFLSAIPTIAEVQAINPAYYHFFLFCLCYFYYSISERKLQLNFLLFYRFLKFFKKHLTFFSEYDIIKVSEAWKGKSEIIWQIRKKGNVTGTILFIFNLNFLNFLNRVYPWTLAGNLRLRSVTPTWIGFPPKMDTLNKEWNKNFTNNFKFSVTDMFYEHDS